MSVYCCVCTVIEESNRPCAQRAHLLHVTLRPLQRVPTSFNPQMALRCSPRFLRLATSSLTCSGVSAVAQTCHLSSAREKLGAAMEERYACNSFLSDAVPDTTLEQILRLTLVRSMSVLRTAIACMYVRIIKQIMPCYSELRRASIRNRTPVCWCVDRRTVKSWQRQ